MTTGCHSMSFSACGDVSHRAGVWLWLGEHNSRFDTECDPRPTARRPLEYNYVGRACGGK